MTDYPLVTVLILTYKNFNLLFDSVDSVLSQRYPKIEFIISNDNSDDFDESRLIIHINEKRRENIEKIIINKNERNMGTVKHANHCLKMASGEFIFFLAADDALYDENVLEKFIKYFQTLGENTLILTSQCGMYDDFLKEWIEPALSPEKIEKIKNFSPAEMYRELSHTYTIPAAGTIYRRKFYDVIGFYDEDYFLIEDSPTFAKLSRLGIKIPYLDIISVKHRNGGLSHGNKSNTSSALEFYWKDEITFFEKEYLKHFDMLTNIEKSKVKARYKYLTDTYFRVYRFPKLDTKQKLIYLFKKNPSIFLLIVEKFIRHMINLSIDLKHKASPSFFVTGIILLLLANYTSIAAVSTPDLDLTYKSTLVYIGLFCLGFELYYALLFALRLIYKQFKLLFSLVQKYWFNIKEGGGDGNN